MRYGSLQQNELIVSPTVSFLILSTRSPLLTWLSRRASGVPREGCLGVFNPPTHPLDSEGPPKSCQTQPDCENC